MGLDFTKTNRSVFSSRLSLVCPSLEAHWNRRVYGGHQLRLSCKALEVFLEQLPSG